MITTLVTLRCGPSFLWALTITPFNIRALDDTDSRVILVPHPTHPGRNPAGVQGQALRPRAPAH